MNQVSKVPTQELNSTHRWVIGLFITLIVQSGAVFFWAATLQAQVSQNQKDIAAVEAKVSTIDSDIRTILIGIEEVKGQLKYLNK